MRHRYYLSIIILHYSKCYFYYSRDRLLLGYHFLRSVFSQDYLRTAVRLIWKTGTKFGRHFYHWWATIILTILFTNYHYDLKVTRYIIKVVDNGLNKNHEWYHNEDNVWLNFFFLLVIYVCNKRYFQVYVKFVDFLTDGKLTWL